jgi:hypothetical protein
MTKIVKFEQQHQELDYFKTLAMIASKSATNTYSQETIMNIMLTAKDLGISPLKALNGGFHVINQKIVMSTAMMSDRIRKAGHSVKIPEWTAQKCVVLGQRVDNGDSVRFEYTMEDAQNAGLLKSPTWQKFPKQMLYNRAMATLARVLFPDVVGNAYSEDEKWDIMETPPSQRPEEDPDNTITMKPIDTPIPADQLLQMITQTTGEEIEGEILSGFVNHVCQSKNTSSEKVISCALKPDHFKAFIDKFSEWREQQESLHQVQESSQSS